MKEPYKIIKEGLAVARFGCVMSSAVVAPGVEPIRFAVENDDSDVNGEEFLVKPFRFLSQALTPYRFFDFTKEGVLENAVSLFNNLTVYANHNADVNQWKGYTQNPVWDSDNDPAGVNGLMVLDRIVDANLARGVEIGALRSASVTIWFEYERSHPDLRGFYDYLGDEVDGEIVRFIVTHIVRAGEVSVVWEGEDPYAKALGQDSEARDQDSENGNQQMNLDENLNQGGEPKMKFADTFLKALGLKAPENDGEIDPEELVTAVTSALAKKDTEIESLKADAEIGKTHLEGLRQQAATLYKALKGDAVKQSYIDNVVLKADLETAKSLVDEYQDGIDKTVPLTCPKCGEKLSRQSSKAAANGEKGSGKRTEDYKLS